MEGCNQQEVTGLLGVTDITSTCNSTEVQVISVENQSHGKSTFIGLFTKHS